MGELRVPAVAWQSQKDELVTGRSCRVLEKFSVVDIRELPGSTHFHYALGDRSRVLQNFRELCEACAKKQD